MCFSSSIGPFILAYKYNLCQQSTTKVCLVKAMIFPVVMYGCERWAIKKAERWRTDVFQLWCCRRLLWVLWTAKSNQSIPKGSQSWIFIGRTDAEAEAPILCPPDIKSQLIRKDPDAGKDWRQEEKGTTEQYCWMASLTHWTWVWASSGSWRWTGKPGVLQSMGSQRAGHDWGTEQQQRHNYDTIMSTSLKHKNFAWIILSSPFRQSSEMLCLLIVSNLSLQIFPEVTSVRLSLDFPGSLMIRTPQLHCIGHEFDSWSGNWDPTCHMVWPK